MHVYRSKADVDALALAAGLGATDLATADAGNGATRVLALSMRGLRFLAWNTATNGAPGLSQEVPPADLLLLLCNIMAHGTGNPATHLVEAWPQT